MNLSDTPKSLPRGYYSIVDYDLAIDGSDVTIAILRKKMDKFFRIAQLGFTIHPDHLEVMNLQGSGPEHIFHQYNLNTQILYKNLQRALCGMKPINALVGVLAILAKEHSAIESIVYDTHDKRIFDLNYATILQAAKFRKTPKGLLSLDLSLDDCKILQRITGANPERRAYLAGIIEDFREKLEWTV